MVAQGALPIPGAKTGPQASENFGALGWALREEDATWLESLGARGTTSNFQHG